MSMLSFLRVIAETTGLAGQAPPWPPRRKLALESLEGRAMLTVLVPPLVQATNVLTTTEVVAAPTPEDSTETPSEPTSEPTDVGSAGGTGGAELPPEPVDSGSASGTGEDTTGETSGTGTGGVESPAEPVDVGSSGGTGSTTGSGTGTGSGSGTGTGEEERPWITSLYDIEASGWYAFTGTAEDNESLAGTTVYFTSDMGHEFTANVHEDGSFTTMSYIMEPGTQVNAYIVDADGNHSESVMLIV